jgi:drug/metabolite transporter (DMT)-like permease
MARDHSEHHTRAFLMLVFANAFWGLSFPLIKAVRLLDVALVPHASGWFVTVYGVAPRFVLGLLIVGVPLRRKLRTITRAEWVQGSLIGLFAAGGMLFQNDGLGYTSASTSAFLTQFYAITIPIWLAFRHRRNPGWVVWVSSVLVLVGVAILGGFDWRTLHFGRGEWETLVSSLFFMGQILWLDKKEYAANRPEILTLVLFAVQGAVFTVLVLCSTPGLSALAAPWHSPVWVGFMLTLTLLCTVGAYSIMNRWQPILSATEAGLSYCIEPIFSAVLSLFLPALFSAWALIDYPNERATANLLIGGTLITLANVLIQVRPGKD